MQRRSLLLSRRFVPYRESSGWEYSFATVSPAKKKAYPCRAVAEYGRCPMSDGEEMLSMVSGLAVFTAFCIAALLWLA